MITLRQWEIFAAVIARGSFRKCADALGISQVTVSEHMRSLEKHLGVDLFERVQGGPVKLTDAGRRATAGVQDLLAHAQGFVEVVAGDRIEPGTVDIAAPGFMMRNLGSLVTNWNETSLHHIRLQSHDVHSTELMRRILAHDLHAAYFYSYAARDAPGDVIGWEPLAIFVSRDHPLAKLPVVTVSDLAEVPQVSLSRSQPLRAVSDAALRSMGLHASSHAVETSEFGLILSSLRRGIGYTCMFERIRDEEAQSAGLVALALQPQLPLLEVRRITRRAARRDAALSAILAMIEPIMCEKLKVGASVA